MSDLVELVRIEVDRKLRDPAFLRRELLRVAEELERAAPKIEGFDALMRSDRTMSVTEAAKHFGLHPKTEVFPYLRTHGYLTGKDLPSQSAIDAGYLALRENKDADGNIRPQAVVLDAQLDTWRTRVVPQVLAWVKEGAA